MSQQRGFLHTYGGNSKELGSISAEEIKKTIDVALNAVMRH
jgi:hypothetical protein